MSNSFRRSFRRSYYIDSGASRDYRLQRFDIQRYGGNSSLCRCFCHNNFVSNHQFDVSKNYGYERNYSYLQNMRNRYNNREVSYKKYSDYNNAFRFNQPYLTNYNRYGQFYKADSWKQQLHFRYGNHAEAEKKMIADTNKRRYEMNKADDYKDKLNFQYGDGAPSFEEQEQAMIANTKNRCNVLNKADDYKNKLNFQYGNHAEKEMEMIAGTKNHRYQLNSANDYKNKLNFQYGEGAPSFEKQQEVMLANIRKKNYLVDKTRRILCGNIDTTQRSTPQFLNNAHTAGGDKCNSYASYKKREDTYNKNMTELRTQVTNITKTNQDKAEENKKGYKVLATIKRKAKDKQESLQENKFNHQFSNINGCQNGKGNFFSYNDQSYGNTQSGDTLTVTRYSKKYYPENLPLWNNKNGSNSNFYDNKTKEIIKEDVNTYNLGRQKTDFTNAKS